MIIPPNFQRIIYEQQERELTQAIEYKLARGEGKEVIVYEEQEWLTYATRSQKFRTQLSINRFVRWLRKMIISSNQ